MFWGLGFRNRVQGLGGLGFKSLGMNMHPETMAQSLGFRVKGISLHTPRVMDNVYPCPQFTKCKVALVGMINGLGFREIRMSYHNILICVK